VGLAPLVGLAPAKTFVGFETSDQGVKVLMTELPAAAFNEVETAFKANPAGMVAKPESIETTAGKAFYTIENAKDATGNVRRYSMIVGGGTFSGYVAVQVPENAQKIYTDDAVRQMLSSAVVRKEVPLAEQLGLMPLLADSSDENSIETSPFVVIGSLASAPEKAEDRGRSRSRK
jgi:hypothetical protein